MDEVRFLIPIFGILLVMIPVTGLTVGWLAKVLAKVRHESVGADQTAQLAAQIALLQEEVESLGAEVKELKAGQDFDRKLLGERGGEKPK